jgi:hypothetical protein
LRRIGRRAGGSPGPTGPRADADHGHRRLLRRIGRLLGTVGEVRHFGSAERR